MERLAFKVLIPARMRSTRLPRMIATQPNGANSLEISVSRHTSEAVERIFGGSGIHDKVAFRG